jgi:hypothetical protein
MISISFLDKPFVLPSLFFIKQKTTIRSPLLTKTITSARADFTVHVATRKSPDILAFHHISFLRASAALREKLFIHPPNDAPVDRRDHSRGEE